MKAVYKESKMFDRQTKCTLNQLFTSVSMAGGKYIYLPASQLGKYPPLATSALVNSC